MGRYVVVPARIAFDLHDCDGVPLEDVFVALEAKGLVCDPRSFLNIAADRGWNLERTKQRVIEAWGDAYGVDAHKPFRVAVVAANHG